MQQNIAETIALRAVAWLVGHEELLPVFLGATGTTESDIRARLDDADFLLSVMDFVLMNDSWVLEFAEAGGLQPSDILAARQALPGGGEVHWT